MKRSLVSFVIIILTLALTACNSDTSKGNNVNASGDEKYVLKLSHPYQTGTLHHEYAEWFNDQIQEKSNGRLSLDIYPTSQLMPGDQELPSIVQGSIDMSLSLSSIASSFDPIWYLYDIPFIFEYDIENHSVYIENRAEFNAHENGGGFIKKVMEDKGLKVLSLGSTDLYGSILTANKKDLVKSVSDGKGLKLRTPGGELVPKLLSEIGASGISIPGSELSTALQQGVIDGVVTVPIYAYDNKFPLETYTGVPVVNYVMPLIISKEKFEKLPLDLQEILVETGKDLEKYADKRVTEKIGTVLNDYKNEGREIYYPNGDELEKWKAAADKVKIFAIEKYEHMEELIKVADEINAN